MSWPLEWLIDVSWTTHDDLKAGITEKGVNSVRVQADTYEEATLLALQITLCSGVYVTRATVQEVYA